MQIKTVILYGVRYTPSGEVFSKPVGHKCRLLPKKVASKLAKRLRAAGVDAFVCPLSANTTAAQHSFLKNRYAKAAN